MISAGASVTCTLTTAISKASSAPWARGTRVSVWVLCALCLHKCCVRVRVTFSERAPPPAPAPPPPPPPPPAPPAPPAAAPPRASDTLKSNKSMMSGSGDLHEELKMVLPQIQARKKMLDIKKTPDIFIDQKSNPDEVAEWLEAKGFSATTQRALRMPGHQLFSLTRPQLEKALGSDEGKRLYSQILVQRNVSGYKTTSASELQSILRKAREKVEVS